DPGYDWSGWLAQQWESPHSTRFSGSVCPHSSKASRGENLEVEHPVCGGYAAAFHFYPTLPGMLSPTLIGHQVVQVGEPRQKRLLAPVGMMKGFHHEQLPVDGVVGLIQQRAGHGHLRVGEHRIPARLLGLKPASHTRAIGGPSGSGDMVRKVTEP